MKLEKKEENIWRKKTVCCKGEEKGRRKRKILDQVYAVRDSSKESQKEKLEAVPIGAWWDWVGIGRYWLLYDGTGSVAGGTGWVEGELCYYKASMPVYIEKVEIWSGVIIAGQRRTNKER